MLNSLIAGFLNWIAVSIVLPAMAFIYDVYRLRKENKVLKASIEELKNAKTKADIDIAIDHIP